MPTTNPVPSQDPSDLLFNAGKLDEVLNGTGTSFTDRLGVARRTVSGMNADFDAQLADAESDLNVYRSDAAASAAQALGYLNTIRTTSYGAYATDPSTDPLGNPPNVGDEYFNTTSNLLKRFNGTTWQASDINTANLAAPSGSSLIGYDTGTVQDVLDGAKSLQDYAALRNYTGRAKRIYITGQLVTAKPDGIAGVFQYDPTDTTSADNGGTIIVGADGRRWKRDFSGSINVMWFGAAGNGNTDDSQAIQAAFNYANSIAINSQYSGSSTFVNGGPEVLFPSRVFRVNTAINSTGFRHIRLVSDGKALVLGDTSGYKLINFMNGGSASTGGGIRYLSVENIHFQNFDTVFSVNSSNLDLAEWDFSRVQAETVNKFIDTHTYTSSRSTMVSFKDCVFQYSVVQIARIFCDVVTFYNCWIGSGNSSTNSIYANSSISFFGCEFIPSGSTSIGRAAVYLTNDDGNGGTANDVNRGVYFHGCRMSNEGGQGPIVVSDFQIVNNNTTTTPIIAFNACTLAGYSPNAYESGNSESGIVYLKQWPASVSFNACGFRTLGGTTGALVAKSDALTSAAPLSFRIDMDDASYGNAQRVVGEVNTYRIARSLRGYIRNPDPHTLLGLLEDGHIPVQATSTAGRKKASFKIKSGHSDSDYVTPLAYYLFVGGQGTTSLNDQSYAGASVYLVTFAGIFTTLALFEVTYTKLHGMPYGYTRGANADVISIHFGAGDTGTTTVDRSAIGTPYDVTVAFGTNVLHGWARLVPAFKKVSRYSNALSG